MPPGRPHHDSAAIIPTGNMASSVVSANGDGLQRKAVIGGVLSTPFSSLLCPIMLTYLRARMQTVLLSSIRYTFYRITSDFDTRRQAPPNSASRPRLTLPVRVKNHAVWFLQAPVIIRHVFFCSRIGRFYCTDPLFRALSRSEGDIDKF